ncbi:MAG TPA: hypothetical protein VK788_12190, partial [Terriglobales bacterium]|nr:hypothetical protein [Terriglobales bacterium]
MRLLDDIHEMAGSFSLGFVLVYFWTGWQRQRGFYRRRGAADGGLHQIESERYEMTKSASPHICIIVENQPVPFDRRVWQEARALQQAGYRVSVISPKSPQSEASRETLEGIEIYRHRTWPGHGRLGYMLEYA